MTTHQRSNAVAHNLATIMDHLTVSVRNQPNAWVMGTDGIRESSEAGNG